MLVNLISAIQFISSIDANCLTINPLDYQMYVQCFYFIVGCIPRQRCVCWQLSCLVVEVDVDSEGVNE